jgi:2-dehydro-3-deoxy-D-arabinonate dehydratase
VVNEGEDVDAQDLSIRLTIQRDSTAVFYGETSTTHIHRDLTELVGYLARYNDFPFGAVLLTGTGIVPDDVFTLQDGDEVLIEIEAIGLLRNVVKQMV